MKERSESWPPDEQDARDGTDDAAGTDRRVQQADARLAEAQGPDRGDDDQDGEHPSDERLDAEHGDHEEWRRQIAGAP